MDRHARGSERARVIGDRPSPGVRLLDRGAKGAEARGLRCLRGRHFLTFDGRHDSAALDPFQRVHDRHHRHDRPLRPLGRRRHDRPDQLGAHGRPRRVVDQDEGSVIVTRAGQCPETGDHRVGARVAAGDDEAAIIGGF